MADYDFEWDTEELANRVFFPTLIYVIYQNQRKEEEEGRRRKTMKIEKKKETGGLGDDDREKHVDVYDLLAKFFFKIVFISKTSRCNNWIGYWSIICNSSHIDNRSCCCWRRHFYIIILLSIVVVFVVIACIMINSIEKFIE